MPRLFFPHAVKHRGGRGVVRPQAFSKIGIDALIFLLQGNGEGQNFAFGQLFELFHDAIAYRPAWGGDNLDSRFWPETLQETLWGVAATRRVIWVSNQESRPRPPLRCYYPWHGRPQVSYSEKLYSEELEAGGKEIARCQPLAGTSHRDGYERFGQGLRAQGFRGFGLLLRR